MVLKFILQKEETFISKHLAVLEGKDLKVAGFCFFIFNHFQEVVMYTEHQTNPKCMVC